MERKVHNSQCKILNTSNGITLVALVITIIILLILAGVAINMAINSDGLFGKANEAVCGWNTAVEEEKEALLKLETKFLELESNSDNEMVAYYIDEVPVPEGFTYVEGTKTTGIIIKNKTDGNEFVWIPANADEIEEENESNALYNETNYPKSYEMIASIREYGGYYMARYSAGSEVEITVSGQMENVYSQQDKYRYNCGTFNQMIELCLGMYPDDNTNKTGVLSHYQLEGMTICEVYEMGCFPEKMEDINEWYGSAGNTSLEGGAVYISLAQSYNQTPLDHYSIVAKTTLNTILNANIFMHRCNFRPVLYIKLENSV